MLRETSEIAVVMNVTSAPSNPNSMATDRPLCRAVTISATDATGTRHSFAAMGTLSLGLPVQIRQAFLEIQGRPDSLQRQSQLHHRKSHLRLDADDHRNGAAQSKHVRDGPHHARGERIDHVEHRYIDDHAT